jgi:hypothetical protein
MGQRVRVQHVGWFVLLVVLTAWVLLRLLGVA